jgi:hypothetical protein
VNGADGQVPFAVLCPLALVVVCRSLTGFAVHSTVAGPGFDHVMFRVACCTAFFGFLRASEFTCTCSGQFYPAVYLTVALMTLLTGETILVCF